MDFYYETNSTDPCFNLAFEEYLLTHKREGDILMLWQNDNTVVIGQNQNVFEEVNLEFARANGVSIVRRATGGGAVYHDLNNLNYSFITDCGNDKMVSLARFSAPVIAALKHLGVNAEVSGRNDVTVCGKKVSGTAQRISDGRILHHGTLLFNSDRAFLEKVLTADKNKYLSKGAKSVESRVANLIEFLPVPLTIGEFWAEIRRFLFADRPTSTLSADEIDCVKQLTESKYRTDDRTFGKTPKFTYHSEFRFSGGTLKTSLSVDKGVISDIAFFGDFMSTVSLDGLSLALIGCPYAPDAVEKKLSSLPLSDYFGSIQVSEVLKSIF